jgi:hypothetical protein
MPQIEVLSEIFEEFKHRASIRTKWREWKLSAWGANMSVHHKTHKTQCPFDLGFYEGKLHLSSYLPNHIYLRYATDAFWIELAHLCEETDVKWDTHEFPRDYNASETNRTLYRTEKSVFFCMMRNYWIGMQLEGGNGGIGGFSLTWLLDGDWRKLLEEGGKAIRRIYALNYHLWRWHYQTTYRWLRKDAKERGYDFNLALKQFFPDDAEETA